MNSRYCPACFRAIAAIAVDTVLRNVRETKLVDDSKEELGNIRGSLIPESHGYETMAGNLKYDSVPRGQATCSSLGFWSE